MDKIKQTYQKSDRTWIVIKSTIVKFSWEILGLLTTIMWLIFRKDEADQLSCSTEIY